MPITHATTTAIIGEAEWNEAHDISALTLDEINDGTTNKAFTATLETKLNGIEAGAQANVVTTFGQVLARTLGA